MCAHALRIYIYIHGFDSTASPLYRRRPTPDGRRRADSAAPETEKLIHISINVFHHRVADVAETNAP